MTATEGDETTDAAAEASESSLSSPKCVWGDRQTGSPSKVTPERPGPSFASATSADGQATKEDPAPTEEEEEKEGEEERDRRRCRLPALSPERAPAAATDGDGDEADTSRTVHPSPPGDSGDHSSPPAPVEEGGLAADDDADADAVARTASPLTTALIKMKETRLLRRRPSSSPGGAGVPPLRCDDVGRVRPIGGVVAANDRSVEDMMIGGSPVSYKLPDNDRDEGGEHGTGLPSASASMLPMRPRPFRPRCGVGVRTMCTPPLPPAERCRDGAWLGLPSLQSQQASYAPYRCRGGGGRSGLGFSSVTAETEAEAGANVEAEAKAEAEAGAEAEAEAEVEAARSSWQKNGGGAHGYDSGSGHGLGVQPYYYRGREDLRSEYVYEHRHETAHVQSSYLLMAPSWESGPAPGGQEGGGPGVAGQGQTGREDSALITPPKDRVNEENGASSGAGADLPERDQGRGQEHHQMLASGASAGSSGSPHQTSADSILASGRDGGGGGDAPEGWHAPLSASASASVSASAPSSHPGRGYQLPPSSPVRISGHSHSFRRGYYEHYSSVYRPPHPSRPKESASAVVAISKSFESIEAGPGAGMGCSSRRISAREGEEGNHPRPSPPPPAAASPEFSSEEGWGAYYGDDGGGGYRVDPAWWSGGAGGVYSPTSIPSTHRGGPNGGYANPTWSCGGAPLTPVSSALEGVGVGSLSSFCYDGDVGDRSGGPPPYYPSHDPAYSQMPDALPYLSSPQSYPASLYQDQAHTSPYRAVQEAHDRPGGMLPPTYLPPALTAPPRYEEVDCTAAPDEEEEEEVHPLLRDYDPDEDNPTKPRAQGKQALSPQYQGEGKNDELVHKDEHDDENKVAGLKKEGATGIVAEDATSGLVADEEESNSAACARTPSHTHGRTAPASLASTSDDTPVTSNINTGVSILTGAAVLTLPHAVSEVDFDFVDPPSHPIEPPGTDAA